MKHLSFVVVALACLGIAGCTETIQHEENPRILLMGDSMMAAHGVRGQAVADAMERRLGEQVVDRSVTGARFIYALPISGAAGLNITKQYREGNWNWVVLNGGGNDLLWGCGCGPCRGKINRLISEDGRRGVIPSFVSKMRQSGANVVFVGYLRTPGVTSPIEHCVDEGQEMDRRVAKLAALDRGVHFVSLQDLVPDGDRSYHAVDLIHPSVKGSDAIGALIAETIMK